ncbi:hypothetical protein Q0590_19245 [Rhodocytophaga aerolata]|uniref:ARG and Rhodanese-Phosphatase-superfamily-associated domain-containing protein n=1 Tax=Rhodocytophaga aerolata TaxID=455078 RepID=A0ABT8RCJ2_9BACT|nr:DUF6569 family protein [Rhodocytophaga aerolata]MDO1448420.1 hypothetical protein [Rhodocytophaga aerolata]
MKNILQAQLAEYVSACAFTPFEYPVDGAKLQIYTLHAAAEFSKPVIELSQALSKELAQITEIDTAGSVQELTVINQSECYLLIYEGSLLKGSKQNRVVNATLLLPPFSKNVIPASCVEQGRWRYSSPTFAKSEHDAPLFMRKCIREDIYSSRNLRGNQASLWKAVSNYSDSKKVYSQSSDFDDIYSRSQKPELIFPMGLNLPPTQGILVQNMGDCSMDFMANEKAFAGVLPRLVSGYEFSRKKEEVTPVDEPGKLVAKWILEGTVFEQPSVAIGTDIRIESPATHISALIVEGEVVSISMTPK